MPAVFEQLSIFTMLLPDEAPAICLMDDIQKTARKPESWMLSLVPDGEYVVDVGEHPLVLRPADVQPNKIRPEYRYYHYLICGKVYAGIFVGREIDG